MIPTGYFWLNVLLLAIGTFAIRGSIITLSARIKISDRFRELFSFIPAAVLPALLAPAVFYHSGEVTWLLGKERFFVLVLAVVVSYFSRSMLATVGFGLVVLYIITHGWSWL